MAACAIFSWKRLGFGIKVVPPALFDHVKKSSANRLHLSSGMIVRLNDGNLVTVCVIGLAHDQGIVLSRSSSLIAKLNHMSRGRKVCPFLVQDTFFGQRTNSCSFGVKFRAQTQIY